MALAITSLCMSCVSLVISTTAFVNSIVEYYRARKELKAVETHFKMPDDKKN